MEESGAMPSEGVLKLLQRSVCLQVEAKTTHVEVHYESTSGQESGSHDWPGLGNSIPHLARRVQAIMLSNDLVSTTGEPLSGRAEQDSLAGSSKSRALRELHSLTGVHRKNKAVSAVQWIPQRKGAIAVCYTEQVGPADAADTHGEHAILFWVLKDVVQPEAILVSPYPILSFHVSPCSPSLVLGGCTNGRIVIWDQSAGQQEGPNILKTQARISNMETSHRIGVLAVRWLPGYGLASGKFTKVHDSQCTLFASLAPGDKLMFWDTQATTVRKKGARDQDEDETELRPVLAVPLEAAGVGLTAVSMLESLQPDLHILLGCTDGSTALLSQSAIENPVGCEGNTCKLAVTGHCGAPCKLELSPFMPRILLMVADWTFSVWNSGDWQAPMFSSPFAPALYASGGWSLTRPGVLFMARMDGVIEVWDLLDTTDRPAVTAPVSSAPLTTLCLGPVSSAGAGRSLLAAGDEHGVLHVLEVPRRLRKEVSGEARLVMGILQSQTEID